MLAIRDAGFLPEAEAHRRAATAGVTIGEFVRDDVRYPLARIFETAERAARRDPADAPALRAALADADSAVRYWAATGLLIRGAEAVAAARAALRAAFGDDSPSVRIVAAEALAWFGDADDRAAALGALAPLMSPAENGPYVAMAALNAVDALGEIAAPLWPQVAGLPLKAPGAPGRANGYVERLVETISGRN